MFLPQINFVTYDHMLRVLDGEKKAFKTYEIQVHNLQRYWELRLCNVLKAILPHPEIEAHLPDRTVKIYKVNQD